MPVDVGNLGKHERLNPGVKLQLEKFITNRCMSAAEPPGAKSYIFIDLPAPLFKLLSRRSRNDDLKL